MEDSLETIPFLDVEINDTSIETWVCRKPTDTNLFLNINVMYCPTKWKFSIIFCLLNIMLNVHVFAHSFSI